MSNVRRHKPYKIKPITVSDFGTDRLEYELKRSHAISWATRMEALDMLRNITDEKARNRIRDMALTDEATEVRRLACVYALLLKIFVKGEPINFRNPRPLAKMPQMKTLKENLKLAGKDIIKQEISPTIGMYMKVYRDRNPKQWDLIDGRQISDIETKKFFKRHCDKLGIVIIPRIKETSNEQGTPNSAEVESY